MVDNTTLITCIATDDLLGLQQLLRGHNVNDITIEESFIYSYSEWDSWLDESVCRERTCKMYSTLFQFASKKNSVKIAKWLLEMGASVEGFVTSSEDSKKLTAAHLAASSGSLEIIELLAQNAKNLLSVRTAVAGQLPLHTAIIYDRIEVVKFLLSLNEPYCTANTRVNFVANCSCSGYGHTATYTMENDDTPLHLAKGVQMVELLIEYKADVNAVNSNYGLTPLHTAGSAAVASTLLQNGADPTIKSKAGETPLQRNSVAKVKEVLEKWNTDLAIQNILSTFLASQKTR